MNMVYFGENGLTSTSANFIANKSKEIFEGLQKEFEGLSFVNVNYKVAGVEDIKVEAGRSKEWLDEKLKGLKLVGKLKSLNAWLREAISAKEEAENELKRLDINDWLRSNNVEIHYQPQWRNVTETEVINNMEVGERQKYLELEAQAANLGKLIHPDGDFSKARKAIKHQNGKSDVQGVGTPSLTVITYSSSVDIEEIDKIFLQLQEEYRALQAELNGMKHAIKMKQTEEQEKVMAEYKVKTNEYNAWVKEKQVAFNEYVASETRRLAGLKVIIPDNLKDIYAFVKNA